MNYTEILRFERTASVPLHSLQSLIRMLAQIARTAYEFSYCGILFISILFISSIDVLFRSSIVLSRSGILFVSSLLLLLVPRLSRSRRLEIESRFWRYALAT